MKVKEKEKEEKKFNPIDITITLENQNEVDWFWCLFNQTKANYKEIIKTGMQHYMKKEPNYVDIIPILEILDKYDSQDDI